MNKKQWFVLFLGIIAIIAIVIFTPRYKVSWIDAENFIVTEQSSSLYKRASGTVKLHWDKIILYSSLTVLACAGIAFVLREKNG